MAARGTRVYRSDGGRSASIGISQHAHPAAKTISSGIDTADCATGGPISEVAAAARSPDAPAAAT
jgi:hypothetical protein